eukprot:293213-Rhodomonas_salina.2
MGRREGGGWEMRDARLGNGRGRERKSLGLQRGWGKTRREMVAAEGLKERNREQACVAAATNGGVGAQFAAGTGHGTSLTDPTLTTRRSSCTAHSTAVRWHCSTYTSACRKLQPNPPQCCGCV